MGAAYPLLPRPRRGAARAGQAGSPAVTTAESPVLRLRPDRPDRLEAALVGAGAHLEEVLDVGTAANGDLLLVLPTPAAHLPALLAAPGGLTTGEAVTVLVPLAGALQRLHDAGVTHGGVGPQAVLLDAEGSPAWSVPSAPVLRRRVGPSAFADAVAVDRAAFDALCAGLLGPAAAGLPADADLDVLAGRLYRLAPPEAVRLRRPAAHVAIDLPARLVLAAPPPGSDPAASGGPLPAVRATARAAAGAAAAALLAVRARVWVAFGGVVALLVGALVLLPAGDRSPAATRASAAPVRASADPVATPVARRDQAAEPALAALLAERDRCLERGSEACLRSVDAAGSPVLAADLDAVRAGTTPIRIDRRRLRVQSTAGGSALATAADATVLAIQEPDGWRLRDVVAAPPAGG